MQETLTGLLGGAQIHQAIGIAGVGFYISSYLLLQMGIIRGVSYTYAGMNLIGASFVLFSLASTFNLASAIIQTTWIVISAFGIARIFVLRNLIRFDEEEAILVDSVLSEMPPYLARRLLSRGTWRDAAAGDHLTVEGQPVRSLHFLLSGMAAVEFEGRRLASITSGFVGEMNVLQGRPATATVTIVRPGRVFEISGEVLRGLCRKDTEFRAFLELHLSEATRAKLVEVNRRA